MKKWVWLAVLALVIGRVGLGGYGDEVRAEVSRQAITVPIPWQVIELTNVERLREGLPPLAYNLRLEQSAQGHSQAMADDHFYDHVNPLTGSQFQDRITAAGYGWFTCAENIAAGYVDAQDVVTGWMNSPGHRANILNGDYREIGTGYAYVDPDPQNYKTFWTQNFGAQADYFPIVLANEAYYTATNGVQAYIYGQEVGATQMRFAIDGGMFGAWEAYTPVKDLTLPNTPGEHTVAVEIQTGAGVSYNASDTIILLGSGETVATSTPITSGAIPALATPEPPDTSSALADDDAVQGNSTGPIELVVFSDYQCGYCAQFGTEVVPQILQAYPGQVRYIHRDYVAFGPVSDLAAQAAECAEDQGSSDAQRVEFYAQFEQMLYEHFGMFSTTADMVNYARDLGLDTAAFEACLNSGRFAAEVAKDTQDGIDLGFPGIPTFFLNGTMYVGATSYADLAGLIDQALASGAAPAVAELPTATPAGMAPQPTPTFKPLRTLAPTATAAPLSTVIPPTLALPVVPTAIAMQISPTPTVDSAVAGVTGAKAPGTALQSSESGSSWRCLPWLWIFPLIMLSVVIVWLLLHYLLAHELWNWPGWASMLCKLMRTAFLIYLLLIGLVAGLLAGGLCSQKGTLIWRADSSRSAKVVSVDAEEPETAYVFEGQNTSDCQGCHVYDGQNRRMAYTRERLTGPVYIWEDGSEKPLTFARSGGDDVTVRSSYMAFSPDGKQLAVALNDADIYIYDFASGEMTPVPGAADPIYIETMPTWTSDGSAIIFVRSETPTGPHPIVRVPTDLYRVDVTGGTLEAVPGASTPGVFEYYPVVSSSSRLLAFTRHQGQSTYADPAAEILLMPLDGSRDPVVVAGPGASRPGWSTDGQYLSYSSTQQDPASDIFVVRVQPDGTFGEAMTVNGAALPGVFERSPATWAIEPELSWADFLLGMLPWLLPIIPWLILIKLGCSKKMEEEVVIERPVQQARSEARPLDLPPWDGLNVLWEPQSALIVGLGLAGRWTLTHLKKTLWDAGLGTLPENVPLLCVAAGDYAQISQEGAPSGFAFGGCELDASELIEWRDNLQTLARDADQDDALRGWINSAYLTALGQAAQDPRNGLQGRRALGRMALIGNLRGIANDTGVQLWDRLVELAQRAVTDRRLTVILVTDTSDDIGSGEFLDMAYLLRRLEPALGLNGVRIVGHLVTDRVRGQSAQFRDQVNTAAALRELERFQLAGNQPFPMSYAKRADQPTPHDGQVDKLLFDELYLYDGEGRPARLNSVEPEYGTFPAIADSIALWLDKAAKIGDLAARRDERLGATREQQRYRGRMMVSSLGIRQYRLPFADLLEEITLRYARQVLQHFLMGTSTDRPALDSRYVLERFIKNDETAQDITRAFVTERLGSPRLDPEWRTLIAALVNNDYDTVYKQVGRVPVEADVQEGWRLWLAGTITLLLNGQSPIDGSVPQFAVLRGAKIALVDEFLVQLVGSNGRGGVLGNWAQMAFQAAQDNGIEPAAANLIGWVASYTHALRGNLRQIADALGYAPGVSLYRDLDRQGAQIKKNQEDLSKLVTRRYIWTDAKDHPLSEVFYEPVIQHLNQALGQMYWRIEGEYPVLALHMPGGADVIFNPGDFTDFKQALLTLGQFAAQDIRNQMSLSSILRNNVLHPDNVERTMVELMQESGPALNVREDVARSAIPGLILSASQKMPDIEKMDQALRSRLHKPDDLVLLRTTDPFTLTLAQVWDTVPVDAVPSVVQDYEQYMQETGLRGSKTFNPTTAVRTAIFEAEATALLFERRLADLRQQPRLFSPLAVTLLANRVKAEVYLLAAASGQELVLERGAVFNAPEWQLTLVPHDPARQSPRGVRLIQGMFVFMRQIDETTARAIRQRYDRDDQHMDAWEEWEGNEGADWLDASLGDVSRHAIEDLIAITRLLIRAMW